MDALSPGSIFTFHLDRSDNKLFIQFLYFIMSYPVQAFENFMGASPAGIVYACIPSETGSASSARTAAIGLIPGKMTKY
jgi:hypothetical protein